MTEGGSLLLGVCAVAVMLIGHRLGKRRKPLTGQEVADRLGLQFDAGRTSKVEPELTIINRLQYGKRYHAANRFTGLYKGYRITLFDFRYEVEVISGRNQGLVEDPYCFFMLYLPRAFEEVTIYHEGLVSKIKQLSGANDIDFESYAFSRRFRVRSPNPKLAYDFCNGRMIEYLLDHTDLSIELDRNILCLSFNRPLRFEEVEDHLLQLVRIRELMPAYLFEE